MQKGKVASKVLKEQFAQMGHKIANRRTVIGVVKGNLIVVPASIGYGTHSVQFGASGLWTSGRKG